MARDQLSGRVALVTGATSGLGVDFARQLAAMGADLVLVARREDRLRALAAELEEAHGTKSQCIPADLTEPGACERLHAEASRVDMLINNAGSGVYGAFLETPLDRVENMLELDVMAPIRLTHLFARDMLDRGDGYILQIASIAAYQPAPLYATYGGAKSLILSFSEALWYELRSTGVSCTVLSPGVTRTEFFETAEQELTLYQRVMMMESADVVRVGIRGMLRRRRTVVPGFINWLSSLLSRIAPRSIALGVAHRMMK